MSEESHPHFCDCDTCLNGGAGEKLVGAGVVRPAPRFRSRWEAVRAQRRARIEWTYEAPKP